MSKSYEAILVEQRDGTAVVTLNRPERLNAWNPTMSRELSAALLDADRDDTVRAIVITGAGRAFCAGADLTGGADTFDDSANADRMTGDSNPRVLPYQLHKPVIAAINGPCAGGGFALALASDIRVCTTGAKFGTAFVRLGLSGCDIGVSWMLPRLIGASRAWELLLTGRVFDAAEADKLGLVTECVPPDALMDSALAMAERIKANSPFGVWMTKEVMWSNLETGSLTSGIDLENRTQILASHTLDARRAMTSFFSPDKVAFENR